MRTRVPTWAAAAGASIPLFSAGCCFEVDEVPHWAASLGLEADGPCHALTESEVPAWLRDSLTFHPRKICTGDVIRIGCSLDDLARVTVAGEDGDELLVLDAMTRQGTTPPVSAERLPLSVAMELTDGTVVQWEVESVQSVEERTPVAYASRSALFVGDPVLEPAGTRTVRDDALGGDVEVHVYDVYRELEGYSWDSVFFDLGSRARLLAIRNPGDDTLRLTLLGHPSTEGFLLAPGEKSALPRPVRPVYPIRATYPEPQRRRIGQQVGNVPSEAWFAFEPLEPPTYALELVVACEAAP